MEPDAEDEADLLRAHGAGDGHAFGRLYDRYDPALFRFIQRLLGAAHADAAEDLHQETWIAVSKNASAFDPSQATFAAWLFTIARRKVFDHFRRQKVAVLAHAQTAAHDDAAMMVADPGPSPLERVQSRELAEEIVTAVEALPLEQRGVFILFAQAGLSLAEIAEASGATVETVKSRLRYARTKLRQALAGESDGPCLITTPQEQVVRPRRDGPRSDGSGLCRGRGRAGRRPGPGGAPRPRTGCRGRRPGRDAWPIGAEAPTLWPRRLADRRQRHRRQCAGRAADPFAGSGRPANRTNSSRTA